MIIPQAVWDEMLGAARKARANAWAPYSHFHVGAALFANGKIYPGCNVENASYPVGLCAERGALAAAVADGARTLDALVVLAETLIPPCGMCRQALAELGSDMPVLLAGAVDEARTLTDMRTLLPFQFSLARNDHG
jgi:cytidine deaminase